MTDIQCRCNICDKYLGVIRDGKLHKKIVYLCSDCLAILNLKKPKSKPSNSSMPSGFEKVFGKFMK